MFLVLLLSNIWLPPVLPRHVLLKVTRLLAWETALIARVGLFSSVSALVYFQTARLRARIVALVTLERFFSWMGPNVCLKVGSIFAGVVTFCATETLFSRVCQYVSPEINSLFARVVALCAAEGIIAWVDPHVCHEVASCCARVVALCAVERLLTRMSQQMCLEATSCSARVATLIAVERLFSRMFPHVPLETISTCARVLALVATVRLFCIIHGFLWNLCHFAWRHSKSSHTYGVTRKVWGQLNWNEFLQIWYRDWKVKVITLFGKQKIFFDFVCKGESNLLWNKVIAKNVLIWATQHWNEMISWGKKQTALSQTHNWEKSSFFSTLLCVF